MSDAAEWKYEFLVSSLAVYIPSLFWPYSAPILAHDLDDLNVPVNNTCDACLFCSWPSWSSSDGTV